MDEISRDKNGNIVRNEGTVISVPVSGISEYTATNEVKRSVTFTQTINGKSEEKNRKLQSLRNAYFEDTRDR